MNKIFFCRLLKPFIQTAFLLFFLLLLLSNQLEAQTKKAQKPNIVIIFMDDMGYGDLECYNGMPYQTPFINQMAAQGMRFTNFYVPQAVSSASRAGLLTGCYPNRVGISGALVPWSKIALNPQETTIAAMLHNNGYVTGMVGKWHLGCKAPYLPLHFGFDEYVGLPYSNDMWPVDYNGKPITDTNNYRIKYPTLYLLQGDKPFKPITTLEEQGTLTQLYTDSACKFIEKNKNKPFFLYLANSMVHVPIATSPKYIGKSGYNLFGDVMMEVDESVGTILKTLKKYGLDDNTLVIFTSDNGPWRTFGDHAGNTAGLREGKGTAWDGGMRVPCIMYWKNHIEAGTICNQLSSTIDLLPTIAKLTGAALPVNKIDGLDISELMFNANASTSPRKELVYYYDRNSLKAIRKNEWKLVFPHHSQTYLKNNPGENGYPGKYAETDVPMALYNLYLDPAETRDVQTMYPQIVEELKVIAEKYRKALGDDLTRTIGNEVRPAATVQP